MRFGRVIGIVVAHDNMLELRVTLDTGSTIATVRDQQVILAGPAERAGDLNWQADQYTQETIGNELAQLGWEPFAELPSEPMRGGIGQSSTYTVRQLGGEWA